MKRFAFVSAALVSLSALATACSKKEAVVDPPPCDTGTCVTPPPPPPPPPPSAAVSVALAGNIGFCNGNDNATAAAVRALGDTAQVFVLGDYDRRAGCYETSWGSFKSRTRAIMGNHDIDSTGSAASYFGYWGDQGGAAGKGWQAVTVGSWKIIMLTVNDRSSQFPAFGYGAGSEQRTWLAQELAANTAKCTMVLMHNGYLLSSVGTNPPWTARNNLQPLYGMFANSGVDVVVSGNEHRYERFARVDGSGNGSATGIRTFNVGTGGETIDRRTPDAIHASSEVRILNFGILTMRLKADGYDWAFVNTENPSAVDSGTDTCN